MLLNRTIDSVYPLMERMEAAGVILTPVPSTPLNSLVEECQLAILPVDGVINSDTLTALSQVKNPMGDVEHDMVSDELTGVIAQAVGNNLNFVRNVVGVQIKQVLDEINAYIDAAGAAPELRYDISPYYYSDLWGTTLFSVIAGKYQGLSIGSLPPAINMTDLDTDTLMGYLVTGNSEVDRLVAELLAGKPVDWLSTVFNRVFRNTTPPASDAALELSDCVDVRGSDRMLRRFYLTADAVAVSYLLSRGMAVKVPDGVQMGLEQFTNALANIEAQAGLAIGNLLENRSRDFATKNLVLKFAAGRPWLGESSSRTIIVNGDVYDKFIDAGGSPEVLMGANMLDRNGNYDQLLANGERYMKEWEKNERLIQSTIDARLTGITTQGLNRAFEKLVREQDDSTLANTKESIIQTARAYTSNLPPQALDALDVTVRFMVCDYLYPQKHARRLLEQIDRVAERNPDMDIRMAATYATIDLLVDWVVESIQVAHRNGYQLA